MEVLVTLSLIVIIAALGVGSLRYFFYRSDDVIMTQQLLHVIQFAEQEAKARHQTVIVCSTVDAVSCSGSWADGQLAFVDSSNDGLVHESSQILLVMQTTTHSGILRWRSFPYYHDYLQFQPSGLMHSDNASFWFCRADNEKPAWVIRLNKSGRARVETPYVGDELSCNIKLS